MNPAVRFLLVALTGAAAQVFPKGGFPLSAVQKRFFTRKLVTFNIFNLPFITLLEHKLTAAMIKTALQTLIQSHDALRLTFGQTQAQEWYQSYRELTVSEVFQWVDLAKEDCPPDQFISNYCSLLQTDFDIRARATVSRSAF